MQPAEQYGYTKKEIVFRGIEKAAGFSRLKVPFLFEPVMARSRLFSKGKRLP